MPWSPTPNNVGGTLSAPHTSGGTLVLQAGEGAALIAAPSRSPSSGDPLILTVTLVDDSTTPITLTPTAVLLCTSVNSGTDTIPAGGYTVTWGADGSWPAGTRVEFILTNEHLQSFRDAIDAHATTLTSLGSRVTTAEGVLDGLGTAATADITDFLAPTGSGASLTGIASTQIGGLAEAVDDRVAGLLVQGPGIILEYNDVAGTITITSTGGGGGGAPTDGTYVTASPSTGLSNETALSTLSGPGLLYFALDGTPSKAVAGTHYLEPSGSGAGLTGITQSQITGLVSDLAAKAPESTVVHLTGSETITAGPKSIAHGVELRFNTPGPSFVLYTTHFDFPLDAGGTHRDDILHIGSNLGASSDTAQFSADLSFEASYAFSNGIIQAEINLDSWNPGRTIPTRRALAIAVEHLTLNAAMALRMGKISFLKNADASEWAVFDDTAGVHFYGALTADGTGHFSRVEPSTVTPEKWYGRNTINNSIVFSDNTEIDPGDATGNSYRRTVSGAAGAIVISANGVEFFSGDPQTSHTAVARRMLVTQVGSVKVGPGSPDFDFHVGGGVNTTIGVTGSGNPSLVVSDPAFTTYGKFQRQGTVLNLGSQSASDVLLIHGNAEKARITSTGIKHGTISGLVRAVDGMLSAVTIGANITFDGTTLAATGGAGGAPTDATYLVKTGTTGLSAEIALDTLTGPGLLKFAADGTPSKAVAGTDFLAPTGSGAGLTGILAGQVGSVPDGVLKGTAGSFAAAVGGTDFITPSGSGASLTGITASQIGSVPAGILKGSTGALASAVAGTDFVVPSGSGAALTGITSSQLGDFATAVNTLIAGATITEAQVTNLVTDLAGKAASVHAHDATALTTGTLPNARMPALTGAVTSTAGTTATTLTAHAASHRHAGSDEIATATPAANGIPKAGGSSTLAAGWIPDLSATYSPVAHNHTGVYLEPTGNGSGLTGLTATQIGLGTSSNPTFAGVKVTSHLDLGSDDEVRWSSTTTPAGSVDLRLRRGTGGDLEVVDGSGNPTGLVVGVPSLPYPLSFIAAGSIAAGNDVARRPPLPYDMTADDLGIIVSPAPSGGPCTIRAKLSIDGGATFPTTIVTLSVLEGQISASTKTMTNSTLPAIGIISWDIVATNGVTNISAVLTAKSKNL